MEFGLLSLALSSYFKWLKLLPYNIRLSPRYCTVKCSVSWSLSGFLNTMSRGDVKTVQYSVTVSAFYILFHLLLSALLSLSFLLKQYHHDSIYQSLQTRWGYYINANDFSPKNEAQYKFKKLFCLSKQRVPTPTQAYVYLTRCQNSNPRPLLSGAAHFLLLCYLPIYTEKPKIPLFHYLEV